MNEKTVLYQLTETSKYMMGFVIVTKENNVIVIDGGRAEDMPLLKEYVGGRHIAAWILTHPHVDHVSGFLSELEKDGCADFDIGCVYHAFPPLAPLMAIKDETPWPAYFEEEITEIFLTDSHYKKLKERFNKLILLFDNDYTGIKFMNKVRKKYDVMPL